MSELLRVPEYIHVREYPHAPPPHARFSLHTLDANGRTIHIDSYRYAADAQRYIDVLNRRDQFEEELAAKDVQIAELRDGNEYILVQELRQELEAKDKKVAELVEVLKECDEYLSPNPKNSIGTGSILHQKIQAALKESLFGS